MGESAQNEGGKNLGGTNFGGHNCSISPAIFPRNGTKLCLENKVNLAFENSFEHANTYHKHIPVVLCYLKV